MVVTKKRGRMAEAKSEMRNKHNESQKLLLVWEGENSIPRSLNNFGQ